MRKIDNWDDIQEATGEFDRPAPGGYIARIVNVEDVEEREYLRIEWDFAEGEYAGSNAETFNRAGFWPSALIQSYKEKALGFFKAFKTSVEASNPRYIFDTQNVPGLNGRLMGVVLGEEEYISRKGELKTKLYVHQVRSVEAIRKGDFKVPERKCLPQSAAPSGPAGGFAEWNGEDGDLPF